MTSNPSQEVALRAGLAGLDSGFARQITSTSVEVFFNGTEADGEDEDEDEGDEGDESDEDDDEN